MDTDPPPEPPDPGGQQISGSNESIRLSRKRDGNLIDAIVETTPKRHIIHPSTANPSIQTIFVDPTFSEGPKCYTNDDKGPFIIHVSREVADPSAGTSIRAIQFGQFLHKNKISSIINDGVKNVGRNRISVEFSTFKSANDFLTNPILEMAKYKTNIPTYNVTRMGLTKGVPVDWSMNEFVESLVLPSGCGKVLKARRLNRKTINEGTVTWVPTLTVVLTFQGQVLPERIFSYHTSLPIEPYKLPTIMCLNCCRYGHTKTQCRSKPRCFKCSQNHTGESCHVPIDKSTCLHCSGCHFATDKDCPEFSRQQSIKIVMSTDSISYIEASSRFPPSRRSYADIAKEMFTPPTYVPSSPNKPNNPKHTSVPNSPSHQSYRETVVRSPRPRVPQPKGYDVKAHQAIVANISSSSSNGCALNNNPDPIYPNKNLLESLSQILLSIVSTCSEIPLPSNVAQNLSTLFSILNNGPNQFPPVEL